jgi:hypothetical protein
MDVIPVDNVKAVNEILIECGHCGPVKLDKIEVEFKGTMEFTQRYKIRELNDGYYDIDDSHHDQDQVEYDVELNCEDGDYYCTVCGEIVDADTIGGDSHSAQPGESVHSTGEWIREKAEEEEENE